MASPDARWMMVYNGEIYNHLAIRAALESGKHVLSWRGHSDTETLLAAFCTWGVGETLRRIHGMFALALWDRKERRLVLARDRFGEKPLYYGRVGGALAFASELKGLRILEGFSGEIDRISLRAMLGQGFVPPSRCIYAGFAQVPPGCWVEFSVGNQTGQVNEYYDYAAVVRSGAADPITDEGDAQTLLKDTLGRAVDRQMLADVPVGTLLSGGIDSSLITALAAERAPGKVRSFAIGFAEAGFDEAPYARAVAKHIGTDHHELYVTSRDALDIIPALPRLWDEPFGDASQIPTTLLARFARSQVTVALTGDAGDELFGGYNRHIAFPAVQRRLGVLPYPLRQAALTAAGVVPAQGWNLLARLGGGVRPDFFGHKVRRTLRVAQASKDLASLYRNFLDEWHGEPAPVRDAPSMVFADFDMTGELDAQSQVMLADASWYLPGDILTKVDRAGMAVSLEARVPFLDPEVAALAARIPTAMKFANRRGKVILRRILYEMVPATLIDRPKAGFAIPLAAWLKGPLRDWAEDLLAIHALEADGLLEAAPIRQRWEDHLSGSRDSSQALWSVLMFQAWRREEHS